MWRSQYSGKPIQRSYLRNISKLNSECSRSWRSGNDVWICLFGNKQLFSFESLCPPTGERNGSFEKEWSTWFSVADCKTQVTVRYQDQRPVSVEKVVISSQHSSEIEQPQIKEALIEQVVKKVIPADLLSENVEYYINSTGRFVTGGSRDFGMTGRKIIVDTYGGHGSHGGGAFKEKIHLKWIARVPIFNPLCGKELSMPQV